MPEKVEKHAPIRHSVHVDCPIDIAFEYFTDRVADWWPLPSHSVAGERAERCAIEPWVGGRVFERTRSGDEHEWGSVLAWDPPRRLKFTWHPGEPEDRSRTVEVEFRVEADGTRVTLTHTGWHLAGVPCGALETRSSAQWRAILELCFVDFVIGQMAVMA